MPPSPERAGSWLETKQGEKKALFRTRTGDPFLTIASGLSKQEFQSLEEGLTLRFPFVLLVSCGLAWTG